ncbi:DUF444 family protein [Patulibacter sp. NPDC049589]|uniref:DUF444 family protein n=1 Tax=Patulibacter sp. NPDC049589 TaxID=3154731 RepID=UPI003415D7D4
MSVVQDTALPSGQGARDALHHSDRLRRKVTEQLKRRIGEEDIVAAGPDKRIRVPISGTKPWRFVLDRGERPGGVGQGDVRPGDVLGPPDGDADGSGTGEDGAGTAPGEELYEVTLDMDEVEELLFAELELPRLKRKPDPTTTEQDVVYDDIARKGPQVDKKATLRANLERNARRGRAFVGDVDRDDLRYRSYHEQPRPRDRAVVFCVMDVSASMNVPRKRMARLFFYWCVQFLRRRHEQVEIVFVGHTTEAWELTEAEFFGRVATGGTRVSAAYELVDEIATRRFPTADWNAYALHCSDGDNFAADNRRTLELVQRLVERFALVGYLEVDSGTGFGVQRRLSGFFADQAADLDGFVFATADDDRALWPALQRFFARQDVAGAVA